MIVDKNARRFNVVRSAVDSLFYCVLLCSSLVTRATSDIHHTLPKRELSQEKEASSPGVVHRGIAWIKKYPVRFVMGAAGIGGIGYYAFQRSLLSTAASGGSHTGTSSNRSSDDGVNSDEPRSRRPSVASNEVSSLARGNNDPSHGGPPGSPKLVGRSLGPSMPLVHTEGHFNVGECDTFSLAVSASFRSEEGVAQSEDETNSEHSEHTVAGGVVRPSSPPARLPSGVLGGPIKPFQWYDVTEDNISLLNLVEAQLILDRCEGHITSMGEDACISNGADPRVVRDKLLDYIAREEEGDGYLSYLTI